MTQVLRRPEKHWRRQVEDKTVSAPMSLDQLFRGASDGSVADVQGALEAGVDATAKNDAGRAAIHVAAMEGHAGVVQLLLDRGVDADERNSVRTGPECVLMPANASCGRRTEGGYPDAPRRLLRPVGHLRCAALRWGQRRYRRFRGPHAVPARCGPGPRGCDEVAGRERRQRARSRQGAPPPRALLSHALYLPALRAISDQRVRCARRTATPLCTWPA